MAKKALVFLFVLLVGFLAGRASTADMPGTSIFYMDDLEPIGNTLDAFGRRASHVIVGNSAGSPIPTSCTQDTIPWVNNVTQFGGTNISTGTGASGAGIPRVTVSNDSKVQPWDGTNTITVKPASTGAVTADTSQVVALSPNTPTPLNIDRSGSGTITTNGGTVVAAVNGCSTITFYISGSFTGAVVAQASIDGTNFLSVPTTNSAGIPVTAVDSGGPGSFIVSTGGYKQVEVVSVFFSGTANVTWECGSGINLSAPVANSDGSNYKNITTAATTTIKSGTGILYAICVNTLVNSATMTLYDNTAGSGTKIATQTLTFVTALNTAQLWSPTCQRIGGTIFGTGLTAVTTGTADWTVYYK